MDWRLRDPWWVVTKEGPILESEVGKGSTFRIRPPGRRHRVLSLIYRPGGPTHKRDEEKASRRGGLKGNARLSEDQYPWPQLRL